ncbi:ArnT family glycosyltransferase [Taibaiella soli]|uniref:Glycosyltransferase RgtA/B/C/D-like domain-containing protein n=1 Tax=Taibaiella soli TaxID=1649169 RepID=A0A2W2ABW2_9BACT|nr:glycosyltransferase family 39 protein [Taibaiella soli]PZF72905.1 hypothetical protein DN068_10870 [Taibaiella soli]
MLKDLFEKIPKPLLGFLAFCAIVIVPIFAYLGKLPLQLWDESRLAVSAYEMAKTGNLLIPTWNNVPDMWSTKPPFLIWQQALMIKMLGPSELAVRLPSAIAAFLTCFVLYRISVKKFNSYLLGLIIAAVLVTSHGYVSLHGIRTADYDSMLTLFTTLYCFSFFFFLEEEKPKHLMFSFVFMTLAVLTKGVAGMMATPALVLYTLLRNKVLFTLKKKHFYFGLGIFLLFIGGYYLLREHYNPGYLAAVQENELGGRFMNTLEQHSGDAWYYYDRLSGFKFSYWMVLIPCGLVTAYFLEDKRLKRIVFFSALVALGYFTIISTAKTKLNWYDLPLYPFLAVIAGVFLFSIAATLRKLPAEKMITAVNVLPFAFVLLVFYKPYNETYVTVAYPPKGIEKDGYSINLYLKKIINQNSQEAAPTDGQLAVSTNVFGSNIFWYFKLLNRKTGQKPESVDIRTLKPGLKFITNVESEKKFIAANYPNKIVDQWGDVSVYQIQ